MSAVWGAVVPAAGASTRMGCDKILARIDGVPVIVRTLTALRTAGIPWLTVGVRSAGGADDLRAVLVEHGLGGACLVSGGETRAATVARCLERLPDAVSHVVVHDGARPFATPGLIARVMAAAEVDGAACAAMPVVDALHRSDATGRIVASPERDGLWRAQTPQAFRRDLLARAHRGGRVAADDAGLVAASGSPVRLVRGEEANLKLTFPEDLHSGSGGTTAIGFGADVHRLVEGRALVLGGVRIPWDRGLLGHSDADVVCHALADAVLGAAGLGDIGQHFPSDDPAYAGADSLQLLRHCCALARTAGWRPLQADCLITAQRPRLAPHVPAMRQALAAALGAPEARVNVKAGTAEGLGALGREEGIGAQAVVLLGASVG